MILFRTHVNKVKELGLDIIQLHGDEPPADCFRVQAAGLQVIKAFRVADESDLAQVKAYTGACSHYLFDTPGPDYGGTGHRFDWDILRGYNGPTPFLLSGGLGPDSLKDLATFAHPLWAGIDLNSGFEVSPGMKDPVRLRDFIKQFRTLQL